MLSRVETSPPPVKLCIFGDSHLAAANRALKAESLLGETAYEFWGADGPSFRDLRLKGDRIVPGKMAQSVVETVNGQGRKTLGAHDFDAYLFFGARMRMSEFMPEMLELLLRPHSHVSVAVARKQVRSFLMSARAYRFAAFFAQQNPKASVVFAPTSLLSAGILPRVRSEFPHARRAVSAHRDILRDLLDEAGQADGITFVHQPEDTIVDGFLTDATYAVENALADKDAVHKSPAYAKRILQAYQKLDCPKKAQVYA